MAAGVGVAVEDARIDATELSALIALLDGHR
jgi:hypothetical protein